MSSKKDVSIQQRVCEPIVSRGLESLRRIDFFRALKEPVLRMIAVKLQVCFLAPEELLAREGERVDRLWFMGKGTADAVVHGKKVQTYVDGAVIGPPVGLLMDHVWSQTVTTTSFSDFMVLTSHDLRTFFTHHEADANKVHAAAFHSQMKADHSKSKAESPRASSKLKPVALRSATSGLNDRGEKMRDRSFHPRLAFDQLSHRCAIQCKIPSSFAIACNTIKASCSRLRFVMVCGKGMQHSTMCYLIVACIARCVNRAYCATPCSTPPRETMRMDMQLSLYTTVVGVSVVAGSARARNRLIQHRRLNKR